MLEKKSISIDFDRVIHKYSEGWKDGTIYDEPVDGAIEAIKRLQDFSESQIEFPKADSKEFIIGTERELCYRLKKENPTKTFYSLKTAICPNMKKITLQKVLKSIESLEPKISLSEEIIQMAKKPLQRMIDIGRGD